jgi:hypothetical protein
MPVKVPLELDLRVSLLTSWVAKDTPQSSRRRGGDSRILLRKLPSSPHLRLGSDRSLQDNPKGLSCRRSRPRGFGIPPDLAGSHFVVSCGRPYGEGGIRTPGAVASTTVFETAAFNRSATSPRGRPTGREAEYSARRGADRIDVVTRFPAPPGRGHSPWQPTE